MISQQLKQKAAQEIAQLAETNKRRSTGHLWPDQWISRRKRVHILEGSDGRQVAVRTFLDDLFCDAIEAGLTQIEVHGKTRSYALTLSDLNSS